MNECVNVALKMELLKLKVKDVSDCRVDVRHLVIEFLGYCLT